MINASILPFEPAIGPSAPERPMSPAPSGRGFDGAMDDALGTRGTRRDDTPARPPRRAEPARSRETADCKGARLSRRASNPEKAVSAKKADRADETEPKAGDRDDDAPDENCAPADAPQPAEAAKTDVDGTAPGNAPAEAVDGTVNAVVETPAAIAADPSVAAAAHEEDAAVSVEDSKARGRRWQGLGEAQATDSGKAARIGVARGGPEATASNGSRAGHPAAGQPIEAGAGKVVSLPELPHETVTAAQADATANAPAMIGAVTAAVETVTSKPQTASVADAMTAIENAVANVAESIAAVETSAGADAGSADTHDQTQPKPQVPTAPTNATETGGMIGPSDGMRFTVNSAAGNAAYTNAAPRHEEAVLPQIVQSIRLHAVQGTTEARVQLKPEHLGTLNITLRVEQNQVTATIQADVAAVRSWIESHESSLRQALSEQGLHLAKLVVHPDDQQAAKEEHEGERSRRQPRRRSWRDEDATFEVLV